MGTLSKIIVPILSVIVFSSCNKYDCESCVRAWKYKSYTLLSNNSQTDIKNYDGGKEEFTACGDDMIKAEEQIQTTYSKIPVPNYSNKWSVVEGTGTCNCQ